MPYSTEHIHNVKAMMFPAGQSSDGTIVPIPGLALLSWNCRQTEMFFQAYVNGRPAGVTAEFEQRTLLVQIEPKCVTLIEIIAVPPEEKYCDYSNKLEGFSQNDGCYAKLLWPRLGTLALTSKAAVFWDAGSGSINFQKPLEIIKIWPAEFDKWGWGLDKLGMGDFGYSGTGAIGWGRGSFGNGQFGFDADIMRFQSRPLEAGKYQFAVGLTDGPGNLNEGQSAQYTIRIDPVPNAPNLAIESYNEQNDTLKLKIY